MRIRLLDTPLERDEGDFARSAQLMLQGIPPWTDSWNMKLPGADAVYAASMFLFGQTAAGIHIGLLVVNLVTIILVFLAGKRLFGLAAGTATGIAYAILSTSQGVEAPTAHTDYFVVAVAMAGFLLLLHTAERAAFSRTFLLGFIFGIAFLMKQPGLYFAVFAAIVLVWRAHRGGAGNAEKSGMLLIFGLGLAVPFALLCLALLRAGVFPRFWFWTVTLAREFVSLLPLRLRVRTFAHSIPGVVGPNLFLWLFAAIGVSWALRNIATRTPAILVAVLLAFSFAATTSAGLFSPHYFIFMLPALALAIGCGISGCGVRTAPWALGAVALACLFSVALQYEYFFRMTPVEFARSTYGLNPFPEAVVMGGYLRDHTRPQDSIAVLGSESEIYFYAHRPSADKFLFVYSLTEPSSFAETLQQELMAEVEHSRPAYIVYAINQTSWFAMPGPVSGKSVFFWAENYIRDNYDLAAVADIKQEGTRYLWGAEASALGAYSDSGLLLYKRKPEARY